MIIDAVLRSGVSSCFWSLVVSLITTEDWKQADIRQSQPRSRFSMAYVMIGISGSCGEMSVENKRGLNAANGGKDKALPYPAES